MRLRISLIALIGLIQFPSPGAIANGPPEYDRLRARARFNRLTEQTLGGNGQSGILLRDIDVLLTGLPNQNDGVSPLPPRPNGTVPTPGPNQNPSVPTTQAPVVIPANISQTDCSYAGRQAREPWLRNLENGTARDPSLRDEVLVCQDLMALVCSGENVDSAPNAPRASTREIFDDVRRSYQRTIERWPVSPGTRRLLRQILSQTNLMNQTTVRALGDPEISDAFAMECLGRDHRNEVSGLFAHFFPGRGSMIFVCPNNEQISTREYLEFMFAHEFTHLLRDDLAPEVAEAQRQDRSLPSVSPAEMARVFSFNEPACQEVFQMRVLRPPRTRSTPVATWLMLPSRAAIVGTPSDRGPQRLMTSSDPEEICSTVLRHQDREAIPDAIAAAVFSELHANQFHSIPQNEQTQVLRRAFRRYCARSETAEVHWMMPYPTLRARLNRIIAGSPSFSRLVGCNGFSSPSAVAGSRRQACSLSWETSSGPAASSVNITPPFGRTAH